MNPKQVSELHRLTSATLEGTLKEADRRDFQALLAGSAEVRSEFRKQCQIDSLLALSADARAVLADASQGDVIPLDQSLSSPGLLIAKRPRFRTVAIAATLVASIALASGLGIKLTGKAKGVGELATETPLQTSPPPTEPEVPVVSSSTDLKEQKRPSPEESYEQMLVATAIPGSQNRPPQTFVPVVATTDDGPVSFNRQVRPLLSEYCFHCHGPDAESRKAELRLDTEDGAFADLGGYSAFKHGDGTSSEAIVRMLSDDQDEIMPPPETKKKMKPDEIALIKRWLDEGGGWEAHWAFVKPERLDDENATIDSLIQARLVSLGQEPSPPADPRTLLRRVTLDLTGLPPTLEEFRSFEAAHIENPSHAYEQVVDRLLDSKRFGEHRARYWLDAARYADTHGFHFDNYRSMWPYRDWVVDAFNANMPFDQFTIEQLAGDMLPDPTMDQLIATGFNRCNPTTNEGGIIDAEYEAIYATDRVETTMTVWSGLTAGCAACHDHKFDPITQKDFYQLTAFFRNTTQPTRDGNKADHPPNLRVPTDEDRARYAALPAEITAAQTTASEVREAAEENFQAWLAGFSGADLAHSTVDPKGLVLDLPLNGGPDVEIKNLAPGAAAGVIKEPGTWTLEGRSGDPALALKAFNTGQQVGAFEQDQAFSYGAFVRIPKGNPGGAVFARMDPQSDHQGWDLWVEGNKFGAHIIHKWPGNAIKVVTTANTVKVDTWQHVFVTYDGSAKQAGVKIYVDGLLQKHAVQKNSLNGSIRANSPIYLAARKGSSTPLNGLSLQSMRIYQRELSPSEVASLAQGNVVEMALSKVADERTEQDVVVLRNHYLNEIHDGARVAQAKIAALQNERTQIQDRAAITLIMQEKPNSVPFAHILERGEYDNKGEKVSANVPSFLPALPNGTEANRLGLAKWIVSPENPLTARVTVNRFWQQLFGTGLVKTSEDFGIMGETPSHPALLDWLAIEFIDSGWDMKHLFKLLVLSETYQQSSRIRPGDLENDPENRHVARGPRFRLDAEAIRDQALALSGLLNPQIGGKAVKPPQPEGLWITVAYPSSDTANFKQDTGSAIYRRSLYTFWKRTSPPPLMSIFDAPEREACIVRRERTNTPLQALVLMNEPQFVESARMLATNMIQDDTVDNSPQARISHLFEIITGHPADAETVAILRQSQSAFAAVYSGDENAAKALIATGDTEPSDEIPAGELATWTMVASQLLNLDQVINKN